MTLACGLLVVSGKVFAAAAPVAAPAQPTGARAAAPSMLGAMLPFVLIFVIFYFLIIAPQRKQAKETEKMLAALKRGDRVVTSGGLHGTITDMREADKTVMVEVSPGVRVTVSRSAVTAVKREGGLAEAK
jgi:preprotein translocase subunit YajC